MGTSLERISQGPDGVGGDGLSREPSLNNDGSVVAYSTKASNLLDKNVTRADGAVYYNQPAVLAKAKAILVDQLGDRSSCYGAWLSKWIFDHRRPFWECKGATAGYEVDAFGRISSTYIITPGEDYNLETTVVSVKEPRGGTGFLPGTLRFPSEKQFGKIEWVGVRFIVLRCWNMGWDIKRWKKAMPDCKPSYKFKETGG